MLALAVGVAAVLGDATGFAIGRRWGRERLRRRAVARFGAERVDRGEELYARHGPIAIVSARFIPWIRTFLPLLSGASRMPYRRFAAANIAGALVWGVGLVLIGRLSATVPGLKTAALVVAATVVALSFLAPTVIFARARIRNRRSQD